MIDIEKFICSLLADHPEGVAVRGDIHRALKEQGLEYKDGKIVPIEDKTELKESEDERINKEIVRFIQMEVEDEIVGNKWLAYLEKQSELDKTHYNIAEKEKREFVSDGFIKCYADFQDFKEGKTYWLEYEGNDNYNVRSDNLLGKTYHITPCQLYTVFKKQTWLEKQGEQKPKADFLLSWDKDDEKMFKFIETVIKDYLIKAENENNKLKIKNASDVLFFLKAIQKSPLCWIKCSDGLPNKDGVYLVVTDGLYNEVYDLARYDSINGWHKASEILYWMSIPQLNNKSLIEQKPIERKDFISIPFGADSELIEESITIPDGCVATIEGNKIHIKKK